VTDLSLAAFLASIHSSIALIGCILSPLNNTFEIKYLSEALNCRKLPCPGIQISDSPNLQRLWDAPIFNKKFNEILDSSDHRNKARLLAVSELESAAWLKVLPSSNLGNLLDCQTLQIAVALRIGSEICHPHICICGSQVGKWGHHGLSCLKSAGRIPRHSALNNICVQPYAK
jgi:hypothetical protein